MLVSHIYYVRAGIKISFCFLLFHISYSLLLLMYHSLTHTLPTAAYSPVTHILMLSKVLMDFSFLRVFA